MRRRTISLNSDPGHSSVGQEDDDELSQSQITVNLLLEGCAPRFQPRDHCISVAESQMPAQKKASLRSSAGHIPVEEVHWAEDSLAAGRTAEAAAFDSASGSGCPGLEGHYNSLQLHRDEP